MVNRETVLEDCVRLLLDRFQEQEDCDRWTDEIELCEMILENRRPLDYLTLTTLLRGLQIKQR